MSIFSRRKLLQLGAMATVSILLPHGRQVTAAERAALHQALGESIASGWKLFHTIGSPQILAVGQAQLILVQQASPELYPAVKPLFYTGVYRLIGAAQHYQNRYEAAYRSHEQAYIAALEGADVWNMAQSRSWQAYGFKARGEVPRALEVADAALRLISGREDTESVRLRARLLAFSAENAAVLGDADDVQARLDASEELLAALPGNHEEFDQVSWLQQAGACALSLRQYEVAESRLQQAFDALPVQWTLRSAATAVPLMCAYSHLQKRDEALDIAKKALPLVTNLQSPATTQEFFTVLQQELLAHFPHDERCQQFVAQAQRQLVVA